MDLLAELKLSIEQFPSCNAFCFNGKFYTYLDFGNEILRIRSLIRNNDIGDKRIGITTNDDIQTYASIFAFWMEGKAYVPLNPDHPENRNLKIVNIAGVKVVLDSKGLITIANTKIINSSVKSSALKFNDEFVKCSETELVYILFTSGTTGEPKGVPITRLNLQKFVEGFWDLGIVLTKEDKCLQMFDLTFDLSVISFLVPLLRGGCVYTIPKGEIKYSYIYELMEDQRLTFSLMVPSILNYLRPYFDEISCPDMRYSLFCGEALYEEVANEWSSCLPNAKVCNMYGPTENTIFCTQYSINSLANKTHNGVLSIGKPMKDCYMIIVDEELNELSELGVGELCLGGALLTPGYWNNPVKNKASFFTINYYDSPTRFYRTGDICQVDKEGDFLYLGRLDSQVKIQGFRVELSEVEHASRILLNKINLVAVTYSNHLGNTDICLVIEGQAFNVRAFKSKLETKLPAYMIPVKVEFLDTFPLNSNGKIDKNQIKSFLNLK